MTYMKKIRVLIYIYFFSLKILRHPFFLEIHGLLLVHVHFSSHSINFFAGLPCKFKSSLMSMFYPDGLFVIHVALNIIC